MKTILLTLFIVAVSAVPLPKDNDGVEMTMNEVPDGTALEEGNIVEIKLKKHTSDVVVSTELLPPSPTSVDIAKTQAAAATSSNRFEALVVDNATTFKRHPMIEVIKPKPAVELAQTILEPTPEQLPVAAAHFNGQVPTDGLVKVQYTGPEEPGMMSTLQEWLKLFVDYFNSPNNPAAPAAPIAPVGPIAHQHRHL